MRVRIFQAESQNNIPSTNISDQFEEQINAWLHENPDADIHDIRLTMCGAGESNSSKFIALCLIFYKYKATDAANAF